jgi:hypothetical protein
MTAHAGTAMGNAISAKGARDARIDATLMRKQLATDAAVVRESANKDKAYVAQQNAITLQNKQLDGVKKQLDVRYAIPLMKLQTATDPEKYQAALNDPGVRAYMAESKKIDDAKTKLDTQLQNVHANYGGGGGGSAVDFSKLPK